MLTMAESKLELPTPVWRNLNISWALFFIFMGFVNLYVAFNYSTEFWVNFKAWGMTLLNLSFMIGMGIYLYKYLKDIEPESPEENNNQ